MYHIKFSCKGSKQLSNTLYTIIIKSNWIMKQLYSMFLTFVLFSFFSRFFLVRRVGWRRFSLPLPLFAFHLLLNPHHLILLLFWLLFLPLLFLGLVLTGWGAGGGLVEDVVEPLELGRALRSLLLLVLHQSVHRVFKLLSKLFRSCISGHKEWTFSITCSMTVILATPTLHHFNFFS